MRDRQCALNHDAIESAAIVSSFINKPTTLSCVYHLYTDDLLWRNFLSPQCRNCSRDPDQAHLGSTHSSQDKDFTWPTSVRNLKSLALAVAEILHGVWNSKTGYLTLTTPLSGKIFLRQGGTCQSTKFEVSRFTHYEAMNGGAKCRKWGGFGWPGALKVIGNATIR